MRFLETLKLDVRIKNSSYKGLYNLGGVTLYFDLQLSSYFADKNDGAYALSKDVDVGLWSDFRCFSGEPPLKFINEDFVVVNDELHQQFDEFKAKEIIRCHSFLPLNELLEYYCRSECKELLESSVVFKYGNTYLCLSSAEVDCVVEWVLKMRSQYKTEGTFVMSVIEDISKKSCGTSILLAVM